MRYSQTVLIDFVKTQYKELEALYPEAAEIYQEIKKAIIDTRTKDRSIDLDDYEI